MSLSKRLSLLQEKVHLRKIKQIQNDAQAYHTANQKFFKRQENILLNALQFINDVAQKDDDDKDESGEDELDDENKQQREKITKP